VEKPINIGDLVEGKELWQNTLDGIEKAINKQSFETWFKSAVYINGGENFIEVGVANKFCLDWINEHYAALVKEILVSNSGKDMNISFVISEEAALKIANPVTDNSHAEEYKKIQAGVDTETLNPKYTFSSFVVGENSHFAQAASLAAAEAPADAYNPLFIYGSVGLGKTHLLQAIGNFIKQNNPKLKVKYISSEKFTNEMINAIRDDKMGEFRNAYRTVDVLLIDDIQFLINKERTQEEFFHTFNDLYESHRQIVISSDRPPKEMVPLEERLRSRFEWGLIVDIQPPDLETRVAILRKKMESEGLSVPDEVTFYIATKIRFNVRELEGALIKIVAYSSLMKKEINLNLVRQILKEILNADTGDDVSIEEIQKTVAKSYNIRYEDMKVKKRNREIVFPRQIAMYLSRELTDFSLPEIAKEFGKRDHTTIIHAYNKIQQMIKMDSELYTKVKEISEKLKKNNDI